MDQFLVAAFMLAIFGAAVIGYALRAREDRQIHFTPGEPKDDFETMWRKVQR